MGKRGKRRGFSSRGVEAGEGCKKNPFSLMAFSSAAASMASIKTVPFSLRKRDRLNGSGMRGVTGLRTSAGKSRMLGERTSGFRDDGENDETTTFFMLLSLPRMKPEVPMRGLMLRFLSELFLRSKSLKPVCFLMGGMWLWGLLGSELGLGEAEAEACFAVWA